MGPSPQKVPWPSTYNLSPTFLYYLPCTKNPDPSIQWLFSGAIYLFKPLPIGGSNHWFLGYKNHPPSFFRPPNPFKPSVRQTSSTSTTWSCPASFQGPKKEPRSDPRKTGLLRPWFRWTKRGFVEENMAEKTSNNQLSVYKWVFQLNDEPNLYIRNGCFT